MTRRSAGVLLATLVAAAAAPSSQTQEPRFRGGTNLVRLDVYAAANGVAVTDLTVDDFEVFEDNAAQTVTSFELIRARGAAPDSGRREPTSVAEARSRAQQPDTRLFVLFLDTLHTHVEGSYHAQNPIASLLDRVVGEDDLVGVMTPEISARNIAFSPRTVSVGRMLRENWTWGERQSITPTDPREREIDDCYPDVSPTTGIAQAMIQRRRESRTLAALEDLVQHLEGLREERTFVLLLTEGWLTPRPDPQLAGPIKNRDGTRQIPGGPDVVGTTPDGRLAVGSEALDRGFQSCERERALLANEDLGMEFELLMRRANRANVSFYPIDPRGLVVFDTDLGPGRIMSPSADANSLTSRQSALRRLAVETDGEVVLNTNVDKAAPKLLTDVGSYYLLGYVSTNQKLDGRYRKLTVKVKRPGVTLRSRPGYLAPSAADFTAAQAPPKPQAPAGVEQALARLPGGSRATPLYVSASAGAGVVRVNLEVDRTTAATPEWSKGASLRVELGPADGVGPRMVETLTLEPGARVSTLRVPAEGQLAPGRYQIRVQATPEGGRTPLTAATDATVPDAAALLGATALASRRGPSTGRAYQATADPRFRRTERLVVETPVVAADAVLQARLLNKLGQPMDVPITVTDRIDDASHARTSLAELALAPLAPGEYVVEVTATRGQITERVSYALRIVP